jgi:hypothetical protein
MIITLMNHYIRYLFLLQNFMLVDLAIRYHLKSQYFQTHAHWRGFHRSSHYSTFYLHSLIVTTYLNQGLYYSHNLYRQWTRKCETPHESVFVVWYVWRFIFMKLVILTCILTKMQIKPILTKKNILKIILD